MQKFVCERCNYRYESELARKCPYCGNPDVHKELDAGELIEEAS